MLPMYSYGHELVSQNQSLPTSNEKLYYEISPTQLLILQLNTSSAIIVTTDEHKLILNPVSIEPVGVQFHEESSTVDLTTFDGITIHVPLDAFSSQPSNYGERG